MTLTPTLTAAIDDVIEQAGLAGDLAVTGNAGMRMEADVALALARFRLEKAISEHVRQELAHYGVHLKSEET